MKIWQEINQLGDQHFHNSALEEAEAAYIQACEHVQKMLSQQRDNNSVVDAAITSYHNLAECLKCQGRYLTAMEVLIKVHQLMNDGLRATSHLPQARKAYQEGRRKAVVELKYFQWIMRMSRDASIADASVWSGLLTDYSDAKSHAFG